ncbi:hypothetical protein AgCh_025781 [Apium graveolens]
MDLVVRWIRFLQAENGVFSPGGLFFSDCSYFVKNFASSYALVVFEGWALGFCVDGWEGGFARVDRFVKVVERESVVEVELWSSFPVRLFCSGFFPTWRAGSSRYRLSLFELDFMANFFYSLGCLLGLLGCNLGAKIEAELNWERPKTPMEVRSFLGLAGYHRRFVKDFAKIATPLTKLTRKNENFIWDVKCEESFQELKN